MVLYPLNSGGIIVVFFRKKLAKRVQILCTLNLLDDAPKLYTVIFLTLADLQGQCTHQI
jgi:hypothetical protein